MMEETLESMDPEEMEEEAQEEVDKVSTLIYLNILLLPMFEGENEMKAVEKTFQLCEIKCT